MHDGRFSSSVVSHEEINVRKWNVGVTKTSKIINEKVVAHIVRARRLLLAFSLGRLSGLESSSNAFRKLARELILEVFFMASLH